MTAPMDWVTCVISYWVRNGFLLSRDFLQRSIFFFPVGGSFGVCTASLRGYELSLCSFYIEEREIERNLLEDYYLNMGSFILFFFGDNMYVVSLG